MYLGHQGVGYQDYAAGATCIYTVGEKIFIGVESSPAAIYSSSDNGNTWVGSQRPPGLQCLYYDNGKLFASGGGVYLSTDLGNSWSTQYSNTIGPGGETIGLGTFRNIISYNQNLIAAVDFKSIYISSDNGISWTSFNDGLNSDWTFTGLAIKAPYIWALTEFGGNAYRRPLTDISRYDYAPGSAPVYRFWSPVLSRHFYTISESEMSKVINNYSNVWTYEQVAYYAFSDSGQPDTSAVYRFWSGALNSHFYTMNESEKTKLINNYPDVWTYEGPGFYAFPEGSQPTAASAVYRFWSNSLGCHFYTRSQTERDKLISLYSAVWAYEGIAWYAYQ
jgi:hypothetical protein